MIDRILIIGTGLIGASTGLALRANGFAGEILGHDANPTELAAALAAGAINASVATRADTLAAAVTADVIVLAVPVLPILDWMDALSGFTSERQLLTDVGSTKLEISHLAARFFNQPDRARFLPGHPMAGKETGGVALAEAALFRDAMWLFTPAHSDPTPCEAEWRTWVARFGCRTLDLPPERHDQLCAWVSHLPQMLSTALAALLQEEFADDATSRDQIAAIGGRALRETTRLGASPYSMWRDVALTNTEPIAHTLHALEQRLAHLRENLRTPGLRDEFLLANRFRQRP